MSDLPEEIQEAIYEGSIKRERAITNIFSSIAGFISVCTILLLAGGIIQLTKWAFGG